MSTKTEIQKMATEMSSSDLRYQIGAHERHNDFGVSYDIYKAEAKRRGIFGDWRDPGEIAMGA